MRKLAPYFVVMILATQAFAAYAQSTGMPEPQFMLTISEFHGGEFGPGLDRINVKETNISKEVITEPGCMEVRGSFTVSVSYNGAPLDEKDAAARLRSEKKEQRYCTFGSGINGIKPGESREYLVSIAAKYDVSRPGTYEVTVTREKDPDHPDKSVAVKSNTLTIVVPEPDAEAPQ